MATLIVRNLPDDLHRALKMRAAQHGRSTEAEVRCILESTVKPQQRLRMGDALATLGHGVGLTARELDILNRSRDKSPEQPMSIE
jgi:plasmid stability protein